MTDYLEELLPEESEEDGAWVPGPAAVVRRQTARRMEQAAEETEAVSEAFPLEEAASGPGLAVKEIGPSAPETMGQEDLPDWAGPGLHLAAELASQARTAQQAEALAQTARRGGAEDLWTRLTRTRQAALGVTARQGSTVLSLPEPAAAPAGLGYEELDRAVQRDARRYDGGFALF